MALLEAERKKETILEFLQREGWWQKKEEFSKMIDDGTLLVNDKKIKVNYKPKKDDKIKFGPYSFKVDY